MSSKDAKKEETESDSEDDHDNLADSMVESSKQKKLNKFSLSLKLESLKKVQLQLFRYLEDQDHLHFSLCGSSKSEDKSFARASVQLG
ncbi:hypothetical protein Tco_0905811 [Tanacetum coccineum]